MLADDQETRQAIDLLDRELAQRQRPLVLWIGAGVSAWAGYPLWNELAQELHSDFSRYVTRYDARQAAAHLDRSEFPALFELLRNADPQRYRTALVTKFGQGGEGPLFTKLVELLTSIPALHIVTTNVDEQLERHLPGVTLVQRSDLERASLMLRNGQSFICKLHGSASMVESMVFSSSDYSALEADETYLRFLRAVLAESTVVFLGYSVRDEYVIQQLMQAQREHQLFGTGARFVVCPTGTTLRPTDMHRIQYGPSLGSDHREALEVVHMIVSASRNQGGAASERSYTDQCARTGSSIYYVADLVPFGTSVTSQTLTVVGGNDDVEREILVGEGYVDGEVSLNGYSPLHDLIVGIICFDRLALSVNNLGVAHNLLGAFGFWDLIEADAITVISFDTEPTIAFPSVGAWTGGEIFNIAMIDQALGLTNPQKLTIGQRIRRALVAAPGMDAQAEVLFQRLESKVVTLPEMTDTEERVRRALVSPAVRRLLGISPALSTSSIPRWLAFPILRLAKVIRTAQVCDVLGASATRMIWGSERLASAAFCTDSSTDWADTAASYVLSARFDSDLGSIVGADTHLIRNIISFRATAAGEDLRREVSALMNRQDTSGLVTAINAGLKQTIPLAVLQKAHDQMAGLFTVPQPLGKMSPALWGDLRNGDARIARWRARSRSTLQQAEAALKLTPYVACPCGSGAKFKFCCHEALRAR